MFVFLGEVCVRGLGRALAFLNFGFGFDGLVVIPWISWFFFFFSWFLLSYSLCSGWVDILDG